MQTDRQWRAMCELQDLLRLRRAGSAGETVETNSHLDRMYQMLVEKGKATCEYLGQVRTYRAAAR